jgi:menaquinone-dependent protoporphyrinogen oxidase
MSGPKFLIVYGSSNGGTLGIAETIASELVDRGCAADVRPAREVCSIEADAVIIGGALYEGRWHKDARRFARRHAAALRDVPVWLFASGPLDTSADTGALPPVPSVARIAEQLGARGTRTFGGRIDEHTTGFVARRMLANGMGGDFRNLRAVRAWAASVADEFALSPFPG